MDSQDFKRHLREYAMKEKFQYRLKPNDKERIKVNCLTRNRTTNVEFVAQFLYDKLKNGDPMPNPFSLQDQLHTTHNTSVPYHVAWRSRTKILERVNGSYEESYRLVPTFCDMVDKTNPGSMTNYTYRSVDGCSESMKIAFAAPLKAFHAGCRNVVGLDACHLTGKHGGCLMAATALDAENRVLPLAIMVTINEVGKLTFISDIQKGLLESISELFPDHNQKYCFRHMYANFKKYHKGTKLHELVCNVALCYKERHWKVNMDELAKLSTAGTTYMMRELPKQWSGAFYDQSTSSEHTNINFCESFNNMIGQ
ncbi:uncharacterized protein LOC113290963 [Papaver somniferum]|uniref:uncharacterized protein LOC113290963 n=1 Tax=Papaver somniferum TaxID=3469 RepID=UPI000E70519D|nr:uncharacterized protein LOC113290963 [Papaver somniferum]